MRKTSQDGGDSTSITSGIENEIKKPGAIIKTKRNSIKRKVQNFSLESDDAVIEPLLQKDKEKTDTTKQSAKFNLLSKTKTEANSEKGTDKDKLISDDKLQKAALSNASDVTDRILPTSSVKENSLSKLTSANAPLHNHMNTNVFSNHEGLKTYVAPKSQILVEIDGSKHVGYNPSPLIFTTAKIHTDGKTKHMEPVQMTPVPILSTIEVSMKSGINTGETSGHVTSNISAVYIPQSNKHVREQDLNPPNTTISNTTTLRNKDADTKILILTDKIDGKSNISDKSSLASSSNVEIKLTQPNIPTAVKNNFTENKSIQNKPESQPISSTSEKNKTIVPHEAKSGSDSYAFTKIANSSIKEIKKDKPGSWHPENKNNLNETVKPESLDLQRTKPSNDTNSLDKTSKDKPKDSANTSISSRQLQRQSIVLDKDDPMAKLKSNIVSSPVTNESRGIHKSGENQKSSMIELNTLSEKTKLPKTSANSIQITSVTLVSTNNSAADSKIYASTTTAATLNKKPSPITSNIAVTNNPTTNTSNVKNMSAATNKVAVSTTSPAPITTAVANNKSSVPINTPLIANKTSATNIVAPTKISALSTTTTTTSNKISSPATSIVTGNKLPSTSAVANKISNPMTTSVATNKMSSKSTTVAVSTKTSSSPPTTAGNKISSPITTTSATNKISTVTSTINAANNKMPSSSSPTTMTGNKISAPSSTTTAGSKVVATTTVTAAINKISVPFTTKVTSSKISTTSSTSTAGNKISSPSTSATAIKTATGSTTTTTEVSKTLTSNSNSSVKPITSSSSTLPQLSNTPKTKSAIDSTPSVSKPLNNVSTFTNIKSGTPNETSTTTASTGNTKPTSITTTAKPAKVTTVDTPATTSQRATVVKSLTVTTAKSVPTKTIPQPAVGKSSEITPKSSTNNEKLITAKSHSTSISLTTTSGQSSVTSTALAVSSGSSPASAEANKQSDSKSKVIGNGSNSFNA